MIAASRAIAGKSVSPAGKIFGDVDSRLIDAFARRKFP
jgi:hypothetical protein